MRAVARSGPAGREAAPLEPCVGNLSAPTPACPRPADTVQEFLAQKAAVALEVVAGEFEVSRWMKFFIESVAMRPGVVAGRVGRPERVAVEPASARWRRTPDVCRRRRGAIAVEAIDDTSPLP